jgi:hypothetical protein
MIRRLFIWPYSDEAAEEFGRIFTALKRAVRPVQQIDVQIGATRAHAAQLRGRVQGANRPKGDRMPEISRFYEVANETRT